MTTDFDNGVQEHVDLSNTLANESEEVAWLLPISTAAFHIGLALAQASPSHGYAIMKEINGWPHRQHRIETAGLYRALPRMLSQGLIEETTGPAQGDKDDERRRYYRLTEFGAEVLWADHLRRGQMIDLIRVAIGKEKKWT